MKGAEAVVSETCVIGIPAVVKKRIAKSYRARELDEKLRRERTRSEARLLHRAKAAGIKCPVVLQVDDFELYMTMIPGKRPAMDRKQAKTAGKILAKLHQADIIHGDYTPANIIENNEGMHIIDFGLGFVSKDIEDKAVDVFTMLRAIDEKEAFLEGYAGYEKFRQVEKRVKKVESRVRYAL
ncbi:Kae1-associated serine/threonine protein kinase [Candidatus Micrarchaeota archaeon]|nr:Kae1-associated serine/threonine protein kinase [Candidatus Micrarchaeota archaeon]